jgi:hypothetical protein
VLDWLETVEVVDVEMVDMWDVESETSNPDRYELVQMWLDEVEIADVKMVDILDVEQGMKLLGEWFLRRIS